ncbi:hypothetical protein D3C81_2057560 [compost metagenome]
MSGEAAHGACMLAGHDGRSVTIDQRVGNIARAEQMVDARDAHEFVDFQPAVAVLFRFYALRQFIGLHTRTPNDS